MDREKLFLKFIASKIIILVIAFSTISELFLRRYVIPYDNVYQRSKLFKKKISNNTVWGSSDSAMAIYYLKDFLNFSEPSANYQEIEKKIKKYYSEIDNGKVIFNLSINSFAEYRERPIKNYDLKLYFSKREPIFYLLEKRFQIRIKQIYKTFIKNKFTLPKSFVYNSDGSTSYYSGVYKPPLIKNITNRYNPKKNFKESKNYLAFIRTVEFLQNKGIEICFITSPWHKDFLEKKLDMNKFIGIREFYKQFAEEKGINYFDFLEYPLYADKFYDGTHLNIKGSILFTSIVKQSCDIK